MSDQTINLNKARKARAKQHARAKADRNAAFFGLTKAQKAAAAQENKGRNTSLTGHQLPPRADKKTPE